MRVGHSGRVLLGEGGARPRVPHLHSGPAAREEALHSQTPLHAAQDARQGRRRSGGGEGRRGGGCAAGERGACEGGCEARPLERAELGRSGQCSPHPLRPRLRLRGGPANGQQGLPAGEPPNQMAFLASPWPTSLPPPPHPPCPHLSRPPTPIPPSTPSALLSLSALSSPEGKERRGPIRTIQSTICSGSTLHLDLPPCGSPLPPSGYPVHLDHSALDFPFLRFTITHPLFRIGHAISLLPFHHLHAICM